MKRLDWYIARQFIVNAIVLAVLMGTFVVAVDVILNLSRFLQTGARLAGDSGALRQALTTLIWIINLWGPRLLQLANYLGGFVLVAAMGFTCAQLVRRRELVAAMASGLSLQRLSAPIVAVAIGATALLAINMEVFVPAVAPLLTRDMDDAFERRLRPFDVPLARDGEGRLLYATEFDASEGLLDGVSIWERDEGGRAHRRIDAPRATWDGRAWILESPTAVQVGADRGARTPAEARFVTDLDPTALVVRRFEGYGQNLSWRQIGAMLHRAPVDESTRERFERIRWGRLATLLGNLLALVIVLPFYMVREPRNMTAQTLKAAPIAGAALVVSAIGPAASLPGLPAAVGVFVPAMILAPIALAATVSVKT